MAKSIFPVCCQPPSPSFPPPPPEATFVVVRVTMPPAYYEQPSSLPLPFSPPQSPLNLHTQLECNKKKLYRNEGGEWGRGRYKYKSVESISHMQRGHLQTGQLPMGGDQPPGLGHVVCGKNTYTPIANKVAASGRGVGRQDQDDEDG